MASNKFYSGNPLLKKSRIQIPWTQEQVQEWLKCAQDPIYFAEKYIKIVHVDHKCCLRVGIHVFH